MRNKDLYQRSRQSSIISDEEFDDDEELKPLDLSDDEDDEIDFGEDNDENESRTEEEVL